MKCPLCKEWIKKDALKCKHCHTVFDDAENIKDGIMYLKNGFMKINQECDALEEKINTIVGLIFKRHKYSEDSLLHSDHLSKIESYAGKIKDDIDQWEASNMLSFRIRSIYNENAEALHDRVREIVDRIQLRIPTLWEKIGSFLTHLCNAVVDKLLPFIGGKVVLGFKKHRYFSES